MPFCHRERSDSTRLDPAVYLVILPFHPTEHAFVADTAMAGDGKGADGGIEPWFRIPASCYSAFFALA